MPTLAEFNRHLAESMQSPMLNVGAGLMSQPRNIGRGLIAGMQNYQSLQDAAEKRRLRQAQMEAKQAEAAEARRRQDLMRSLFGGAPTPDPTLGPTQAAAATQPTLPPIAEAGSALLAGGFDPLAAQRAIGVAYPGAEKTIPLAGGGMGQILPGGEVRRLDVTQFQPPLKADVGGEIQFLNPYDPTQALGTSIRGTSPDAALRAGTAESRMAFDEAQQARAADIAQNLVTHKESTKRASKLEGEKTKTVEVANILQKANMLLNEVSGGVGPAVGKAALQAAGISTKGTRAAQSLKALQSSLMKYLKVEAKMTDKDLAVLFQGVGDFADPKLPVEDRRAALKVIGDRMVGRFGLPPIQWDPETAPAPAPGVPVTPPARTSSYQDFLRQRGRR